MIRLLPVLLLIGCATAPPALPPVVPDPKPVPVFCPAECLTSCEPAAWPQWTHRADDPAAWDALAPQVIAPLQRIARACDAARAACVQCLTRIERAGLVCGPTVACKE